MMPRRLWKRVVTPPLLLAASLFLAFEELQWRLAGVWAWLGRLPLFHNLERWLASLPPWAALLCFALPSVCVAPFKILAVYWMAGGRPALGIGTIVAAKVLGTALVARLFQLTRPALLRIGWFAWVHDRVLALRAAAYRLWRESAVGRLVSRRWRAWRERWRGRAASWWSLRMAAARRLARLR